MPLGQLKSNLQYIWNKQAGDVSDDALKELLTRRRLSGDASRLAKSLCTCFVSAVSATAEGACMSSLIISTNDFMSDAEPVRVVGERGKGRINQTFVLL